MLLHVSVNTQVYVNDLACQGSWMSIHQCISMLLYVNTPVYVNTPACQQN